MSNTKGKVSKPGHNHTISILCYVTLLVITWWNIAYNLMLRTKKLKSCSGSWYSSKIWSWAFTLGGSPECVLRRYFCHPTNLCPNTDTVMAWSAISSNDHNNMNNTEKGHSDLLLTYKCR